MHMSRSLMNFIEVKKTSNFHKNVWTNNPVKVRGEDWINEPSSIQDR